ncbi:hypothetical protein LCL95_01175 [Bacillus timonensis]|nr:hypothetical protein [Bacillus timonensis]
MQLSNAQLLKQLSYNNQQGVILHNDIPYEVQLTSRGDIQFTGKVWSWQTKSVPSSHGDYTLYSDVLTQNTIGSSPTIDHFETVEFFRDINEYFSEHW